jgi:hypothetical protein
MLKILEIPNLLNTILIIIIIGSLFLLRRHGKKKVRNTPNKPHPKPPYDIV